MFYSIVVSTRQKILECQDKKSGSWEAFDHHRSWEPGRFVEPQHRRANTSPSLTIIRVMPGVERESQTNPTLQIKPDTPNLYQALGLKSAGEVGHLSSSTIRTAYKQALLEHHPDKRSQDASSDSPSIDLITLAYRVLSDSSLRKEYDEALLTLRSDGAESSKFTVYRTGLETVDLDELNYDEAAAIWVKPCRCGAGGGYTVTEEELEAHVEDGELVTGCRGCSLWIRILFSVA